MALNTLQNNTATSAAYLSSRFDTSALSTSTAAVKSTGTGFGQVLEGATAAAPAPQPIVTQSASIPFASFIDNIDFSKFKSDPLHFGQFIPLEAEAKPAELETTGAAAAVSVDSAKTPNTALDSLLGSIEAQLNYAAPQAEVPSQLAPAEVVPTETVTAETVPAESVPLETRPTAELESQPAADLATQYLAGTNMAEAYNVSELLADVLDESNDPKVA